MDTSNFSDHLAFKFKLTNDLSKFNVNSTSSHLKVQLKKKTLDFLILHFQETYFKWSQIEDTPTLSNIPTYRNSQPPSTFNDNPTKNPY